jgi:hypothetical protein
MANNEFSLLYHPTTPTVIHVAHSQCAKYRLYRKGYRKISYKRIGEKLKKARKAVNASMHDMQSMLEDHGVYMSYDHYQKLEKGTAPPWALNVNYIIKMANMLHIPISSLVQVKRGKG